MARAHLLVLAVACGPAASGSTGGELAQPARAAGDVATRSEPEVEPSSVDVEPGPPGVDPAATFPARDGVLYRDRVVVLGRAGELSAHDVRTGARRWRLALEAATGGRTIQRLGERLLVWEPERLAVVDVARGEVVVTHAIPRGTGQFVWQRDGACGLRAECALQLIDCADARPIGAAIRGELQSMTSFEGDEHDTGCWHSDIDLVGRSGDVVVVAVRNVVGGPPEGVVGISAGSGARLWTTTDASCASCTAPITGARGDDCWVSGERSVTVLSCADGRVRFRHPTGARVRLASAVSPRRLFVLTPARAVLLDLRRARPIFSIDVPEGSIAVVEGATYPSLGHLELAARGPSELLWLSERGQVLSRVPMNARDVVLPADAGPWRVSSRAPTSDTAGHPVPSTLPPYFAVERGRAAGTGPGPPDRAVARVDGGPEIARLQGDAWSLGELHEDGAHWLVLYAAGTARATTGEVRVYRAP